MQRPLIFATTIVGLALTAAPMNAQTLHFTTNVGTFDMRLNPGNDPNLQPLVDNILAYAGLGRYHYSAINRAASDSGDPFVLQMGGFLAFPPVTEQWTNYLTPIESLPQVVVDSDGDGQVDFTARSNTLGTVSLALSGAPNSGSSSFFINLGDNSFLDASEFVPFAEIVDMTTIDAIMALDIVDLSSAAGSPGNLTFINVPTLANNHMVVITDVTVMDADPGFSFVGPVSRALLAARDGSSASSLSSSSSSTAPVSPNTGNIPEPTSMLLAFASMAGLLRRQRKAS